MSLHAQINARCHAFASDIADLVQEALVSAFGKGKPVALTSGQRTASRLLTKGEKRSPQELQRVTDMLFAAIKAEPGKRIEQLAPSMGDFETRELMLPAKKLIASKRVTTKGQKRATTYFAK